MTEVYRNPIEDLIRARLKLLVSSETLEDGATITDVALFLRAKNQGAQGNGISVEYKDGIFSVRGPKPPADYALKTLTDGKVTFFKSMTDETIVLKFDGFTFTNGTISVKPNELYKGQKFLVNIKNGSVPFSTNDTLTIGCKQEIEQYKVTAISELRPRCAEKSKFVELPNRGVDVHDQNGAAGGPVPGSSDPDAKIAIDYQDAALVNFPQTFLSGGNGLTLEKPIMPPGWLQPVRRIINRENDAGKAVMEPKTYWWFPTGETTGYWSTELPKKN